MLANASYRACRSIRAAMKIDYKSILARKKTITDDVAFHMDLVHKAWAGVLRVGTRLLEKPDQATTAESSVNGSRLR
jgi:hypothetical protein